MLKIGQGWDNDDFVKLSNSLLEGDLIGNYQDSHSQFVSNIKVLEHPEGNKWFEKYLILV